MALCTPDISQDDAKDEWAERSKYWLAEYEGSLPKRKRRERRQAGLILVGNGLSIRVDRGRLLIKDGITHYPSQPAEHAFFKGDLSLPPRIVIVDGSGSISLDAIDWLADQSIDLIRLKYDGRIQSICSASGYAADPKKVEWQKRTRMNETARVKYAVPLIRTKIAETLFNLENILPESSSGLKAIENSKLALAELKRAPPESVSKLLAIEGRVAQGYFFAWRVLDIKWKAAARHPVPDEWKRFFSRSSLRSDPKRPVNRWATHPMNAMLNYVYGMLESEMRVKAVAGGYDPSIGIMHDRSSKDRHSFVFDQMEPFRPLADRVVLIQALQQKFNRSDFDIQSNGVVRLNPNLAGHLSSQFERQNEFQPD